MTKCKTRAGGGSNVKRAVTRGVSSTKRTSRTARVPASSGGRRGTSGRGECAFCHFGIPPEDEAKGGVCDRCHRELERAEWHRQEDHNGHVAVYVNWMVHETADAEPVQVLSEDEADCIQISLGRRDNKGETFFVAEYSTGDERAALDHASRLARLLQAGTIEVRES